MKKEILIVLVLIGVLVGCNFHEWPDYGISLHISGLSTEGTISQGDHDLVLLLENKTAEITVYGNAAIDGETYLSFSEDGEYPMTLSVYGSSGEAIVVSLNGSYRIFEVE